MGAFLAYLGLFTNSTISIFYTPVMLNLLGQSEYGLYSLANSVIGYITVLNFGLGNAVIRYTVKYKTLGDEESCSRIYGAFFIMYGSLGILALIAGTILTLNSHLLFSTSLSTNEIIKLKILMEIVTFNLSTGIGFGLFSVIILAHERFVFQRLLVISGSIVTPMIMLPLLFLGYRSITLAIVTTVINLISIFINIYYCFVKLKIRIVFRKIEKELLKEIITFSFYIFLNLIVGKLYDSTDQVILGIYSGTIAISIYTIGNTFTGYFSGFSSAISNVFFSKVTSMVTKEIHIHELSELFIKIGRIQYIIISFALAGFLTFGQEFISIWVGNKYRLSFIVAIIVIAPMTVSLIQSMGSIILQAMNKQKFKSYVNIFVAIANVPISVIFAQRWGVVGCALGTAIAFFIGNILIMNVYYWKSIKINILKFWYNIFSMSSPLVISVLFGLAINKMVFADSWKILLLKILLFSISYVLLMWFTAMNKYEKNLFLSPIKSVSQRIGLKDFTA